MNICFSSEAWKDYLWWEQEDRKTLKRINLLVADIIRNGHDGIGKPEQLRHDFQGFWSRRITDEHRLVYAVTSDSVLIVSCRFHYT